MKRLMFVAMAAFAGAVLATQHWNTQGHVDTLLSKAANYNEKKDPNYGVVGGDSNLGGYPTGIYTLDADMTANRIVFDAQNGANAEFNLQGHTLTLLGVEQTGGAWAFGVPAAGSKATMRLTSGTIRVPWQPEAGKTYTNCIFKVGREATATNFTFVVDGSAATLDADKVDFAGNYNTLRIRDGGKLETEVDVTFGNTSNRLEVLGKDTTATVKTVNLSAGTGNGVVIGDGATMTFSGSLNLASSTSQGNYLLVTGEGSRLRRSTTGGAVTVGGSIWGKEARLEIRDGGSIENVTKFVLGAGNASSGNWGHRLAFRDANTGVSLPLTDKLIIGNSSGKGSFDCWLEVTDGASLTLNGSTKGNNRAWISPNAASHDNGVLVSGSGSKLIADTTSAWLVGQHGFDNMLHVTDGGCLQIGNGLTAGQGDSMASAANGNAIVVDRGGVLVANGCLTIGYGTLGQAYSNRMEILSGGIVTNGANGIRIGSSTNAHYCTFHMDNGLLYDSGHVYVGLLGKCCRMTLENDSVFTNVTGDVRAGADAADSSPSNAIEVLSGSSLYTRGAFRLCGIGAALTVSNGTIVCGGTLQLPYDNISAADPVITIAGTNSSISTTGEFLTICRNATLNFVLPATGCQKPVFRSGAGKTLTIKNIKSVNWRIPAELIARGKVIILAEPGAGGALAIDESTLAKFREGLPEGCRVKISNGKLVLLTGLRGLTMIIR